jgi:hypothetical protein
MKRINNIYRPIIFILILAMLAASGCVKRKDSKIIRDMRSRSIEQVFDAHRDSLLSILGVVGAGIAKSENKPCIMVMVQDSSEEILRQIPQELDGYKVIVEQTGEFKTLSRP